MTLPINSLANMEYMLYGGTSGLNSNCPSYINGYQASNPYTGYYNPQYLQNYANYQNNISNPNGIAEVQNSSNAAQQTQITGTTGQNTQTPVTNADINALTKFYKDSNSMVQKWGDIGTSALFIAAAENSQVLKHPFNSIRAIKATNMIFDKSNTAIQALWQKNPQLMQRAYGQLHAVNRMAQPKFSFVQKWFQKPITETARKDLEKIMADAIKSGDEKAILRATETLKASRGMDGYIPTAWNKVKNFFGGNAKNLTPQERILKKAADIDKAVNAPAALKPGVGGLLKQGLKEGKTFAIFGMVMDLPKIFSAYKNGGIDSALTQITQTGIRSVADGIGWTLGRAAGGAIGTKVGATIGTAVCPGLGTAVGAVLGFLGGAAGSILASKITHALIPTDEGTKLEAQNLTKTKEGRENLLSLVAQKYEAGETIPQNVLIAANNVQNAMA